MADRSLQFRERTTDSIAPAHTHQFAREGNEVRLGLIAGEQDGPIYARVTHIQVNESRIMVIGTISRDNTPGLAGDNRLTKDRTIHFTERNILEIV